MSLWWTSFLFAVFFFAFECAERLSISRKKGGDGDGVDGMVAEEREENR